MNIYSDDRFCKALQVAYYPEQALSPAQFQLGDRVWKLPARSSLRPIVLDTFASAFIDFYEPDTDSAVNPEALPPVGYLPLASHGMVTTAEWFEENLEKSYEAAPTVVWSNFESWDMFVQHVKQRRSSLFADSRRQRRKLEQELGELKFVFDDRRITTRETCMRWKSAQYQRSKCTDNFAFAEHVRFFEELAAHDLLLVSSLQAGDKLIAAHLGAFAEGRLYWWIPSYDATYSNFSPGRLLQELALEASFEAGHREFDFLIGGEAYKWYYATHTRLIAPIGTPPLSLRLNWAAENGKETVKSLVRQSLKPFPGLLETLKATRR
jgi:ribosomal protein L44E